MILREPAPRMTRGVFPRAGAHRFNSGTRLCLFWLIFQLARQSRAQVAWPSPPPQGEEPPSAHTVSLAGPKPVPAQTTWQWILNGPLDLSVPATLYDIDMFNYASNPATVAALKKANRTVICYFSAGTLEGQFGGSKRVDYSNFTGVRLGKPVSGFEDEAWINIKDISLPNSRLAAALRWRFDYAKRIGCDGVEPDNVDAYVNNVGIALTYNDQLTFNRWLANEGHLRNLSVALKNDGDQVNDLVQSFDFAVVEQCYQYSECSNYNPFIKANKAVLIAEYRTWNTVKQYCSAAGVAKYSLVKKGATKGTGRRLAMMSPPFPGAHAALGNAFEPLAI